MPDQLSKTTHLFLSKTCLRTLLILLLGISNFALAQTSERATTKNAITFSVLVTGQSSGSLEAMVVSGGRWFTSRQLVHTAVLVKHPSGNLLWDTGIGKNIAEQMKGFSFLEKQLFKLEALNPAADQLKQDGIEPASLRAIIPSHLHWDHASGLKDFPGIPVWIAQTELKNARLGKAPSFIQSQFDEGIDWVDLDMSDQSLYGFDRSHDVFGDGSVLLVDLSGHTSGQVGMLLTVDERRSYFFIGDTTWTIKGIDTQKGRPGFVNAVLSVDQDVDKNQQRIDQIYQLKKSFQEQGKALYVVPAHDEFVNLKLPIFPAFLE